MRYTLIVSKQASRELRDAYDWYENQRMGLGDDLAQEVEECFLSISKYPFRYASLLDNELFRKIRVSGFPYLVIFGVEGDKVIVHSIVHFKRGKRV